MTLGYIRLLFYSMLVLSGKEHMYWLASRRPSHTLSTGKRFLLSKELCFSANQDASVVSLLPPFHKFIIVSAITLRQTKG